MNHEKKENLGQRFEKIRKTYGIFHRPIHLVRSITALEQVLQLAGRKLSS
jgi:hypothetical protein